jgi:protein phosphatase
MSDDSASNSSTDTDEYLVMDPLARVQRPYPFSSLVRVDLAALSHPGRVRPNNEDRYLTVRAGRFLQALSTNLEKGSVPDEFGELVHAMAVADGMGGAASGEVASRLAITFLVNLVLNTPDWILQLGEPQVTEVLDRAARRFRDINAALIEEARLDPRLAGMGTTLTVAWSLGADLFLAHVGDSRVYLFRQGELHRLTRDQTLAQALADIGAISPREIATHKLRHVLTQAMGMETGDNPQVQQVRLADGDRLLLCTDGLTDMVEDATIAAELHRHAGSAEACQALLDLALQRGGKDNVTLVVAAYHIPPEP